MKRLFCGRLAGAAGGRAFGGATPDVGKGTGARVCKKGKKKFFLNNVQNCFPLFLRRNP